MREEEERVRSMEECYRFKIRELESENKKYKHDFETMKGNLEEIENEFRMYSRRQPRG